jgi:hypothetical protein
MQNKILLLLVLLLIPLVSANGLYTSNQTYYLNKTYQVNQDFIVTIRNADTIPFYNITIDTSGFSMEKIPVLQPNQSANITVSISTNQDYTGKLRIKGYYSASIGASNETIPVTVNYVDGASPCVFTAVKGDTVTWTNTDTKTLEMYNFATQNKIATIAPSGTYSQTFTNPLEFLYYFTWLGFDFSYCSINVLSDTGYITNPDYDALVDLNLNIDYKPTNISATFLVTDYSMTVLDSQDGLMTIKNTGTETAKNISLNGGSWFSFTPNRFDLEPNVTRTISYKIDPDIKTTEETNKTYIKNLSITGNFPTIYQNFTIFVRYADFSSSQYGYASLEDYLKKFCEDNPDICSGGTKVVYVDNGSNQNLTQEQFRKIIEFWSGKFEAVQDELTYIKEQTNITANQTTQQSGTLDTLSGDVETLKEQKNDSFTFVQLLVIGISLIIIAIGGSILIIHYRRRRVEKRLRRWY